MADEFLFLDIEQVAAILPMLANGGIAIFVSSVAPEGDESPLMQMLYAKDREDNRVFKVYNWLKSCDKCKRDGNEKRCTHVSSPPQFYQSRYGFERVRAMLSVFEGAYEREMQNISDEPDVKPAFSRESINVMFDTQRHATTSGLYPLIMTGVDPGAGRNLSEYVIITVAFNHAPYRNSYEMVLLACDVSLQADNDSVADVICSQIKGVREKIEGMHNAVSVLTVESNLPTIAGELHSRVVARVPNMLSVVEDAKEGYGIRTTTSSKPQMVGRLKQHLDNKTIKFHRHFFSARPEQLAGKHRSHKELIRKHLQGFNQYMVRSRNQFDRPRVRYSGKGAGSNDDATMVLGLLSLMYPTMVAKKNSNSVYKKALEGNYRTRPAIRGPGTRRAMQLPIRQQQMVM